MNRNFLCITYNSFNLSGRKLEDINQDYHLYNIIRLLVIAIITATEYKGIDRLTSDDRHLLYLFSKRYLNNIDQSELKRNISSIKNFGDKAKDLWNKFTGPLGLVLNTLLQRVGLASTEIKGFEELSGSLGDNLDQLRVLYNVAQKLGYNSIYILIDRVDENDLTSGVSSNAYTFIKSIISDLQLLELTGYGFKFFLWDLLLKDYRKVARPDRVKYYEISWEANQLKYMLSERLKAYSSGKVTSLAMLMDKSIKFDIDLFVSVFAQGSPRNLIRICKEIIDHQSEINYSSNIISHEALIGGFDKIARNISSERYTDNIIKDLRKTKRANFTIRFIYSDVFKITQQAALNKVKLWQDAGAVKSIGTIQETKGARFSNHYGVSDLLLAKAIFQESSISDFTFKKLRFCTCGNFVLRDYDLFHSHTCEYCQQEIISDLI